jgi:hypothetical protein
VYGRTNGPSAVTICSSGHFPEARASANIIADKDIFDINFLLIKNLRLKIIAKKAF